jgi:hypothetical protein
MHGGDTPMSEEVIEIKPFFSVSRGEYDGQFPVLVENLIKRYAESPSLHFFSGASRIGDERIDMAHPNATQNVNVFDFIQRDSRQWKTVILDPPYQILHPERKKGDYAIKVALSSSNPLRNRMVEYLQGHAENVFWFDYNSPLPQGFKRERVWMCITHQWAPVRALTWLKRKGERLN